MERKLVIILDPAHGKDVLGKCSPDGSHYEYQWSRERCKQLEVLLKTQGFKVYYTSESENEIGLSKRKSVANNINISSKEVKFLLSLHNNAAGSDNKWHDATGIEIWTSPGKTISDFFADKLFEGFKQYFPENKVIRYRYNENSDLNRDKENTFTVLMGNYAACLVEWLFQDNKNDVSMLKDSDINKRFEDAIVEGILYIDEYLQTKIR